MAGFGFEAALEGLPTPAGCGAPKKSSPIRLLDWVIFCAGGATGGAGLLETTSVVLGRAGGSKSSNKLTLACCGGGRTVAAGPCMILFAVCFCEALLSIFAFSCTTFSGTSSSSPNVEGSGIGPSITHLFDSYLVRMKFSILASDGT